MRLADYFESAVSRYHDETALIDGDIRVTFGDARRLVHGAAHALAAEPGLRNGAHIAIYAPNDYRIPLLQFAANRAGMPWVAVHTRNTVEANIAVLDYADCELVFFHSVFESLVPILRAGLPKVKRFICLDKPSEEGPSLADWMAPHRQAFRCATVDMDAPSMLQPTGGTTGPSKGAYHSNRSSEMALISVFETLEIDHGSRVLAVAPLTHAASLLTLAAAARGGCTVVLPAFDVATVLAAIERERITHLFLPPTVVYALLSDPCTANADFSSLRCLTVGGAPIAPEKLKEAVRRFGPVVYEVYGQSECAFPVIAKRPRDYMLPDGSFDEAALRSAGKSVTFAEVEIMDDDGNLVSAGERGEIVVRSTMVMTGYYKKAEDTAAVSSFGWHHTTDIGVRDERGFITIVDRKKDMIVSGGFNLFPTEIESVINSHPSVLDCAVVGVPDEKWGEAVKAVVQLKPGLSLDADSLVELCKRELGSMKAPKSIEFWSDLPRSAVGKVLKREIRDKFWKGQWRSV
jgi:acyl-CoA synthetase (AMP-forming)/AMP-acid ligase II